MCHRHWACSCQFSRNTRRATQPLPVSHIVWCTLPSLPTRSWVLSVRHRPHWTGNKLHILCTLAVPQVPVPVYHCLWYQNLPFPILCWKASNIIIFPFMSTGRSLLPLSLRNFHHYMITYWVLYLTFSHYFTSILIVYIKEQQMAGVLYYPISKWLFLLFNFCNLICGY